MILIQKEWYSKEQCQNNPDTLYIFGDNSIRRGLGGQAQIREEPNSFGICTKLLPSTAENAFFTDTVENLNFMEKDLRLLLREQARWKNVVFPYDGLGTGLSEMPTRAPLLYRIMKDYLYMNFGVNYK